MFDALLDPTGDAADTPEKAAALAAALKKQSRYGAIGQLMGVKPTMQVGAGMQDEAQGSLKMALAQRQAAKEAAARESERKQAQANTDRAYNRGVYEHNNPNYAPRAPTAQWDVDANGRMFNKFTGDFKDNVGGADAPRNGPTGFPGLQPGTKMAEADKKNYIGASQMAENLPVLEGIVAGGYRPDRVDLLARGPGLPSWQGRLQGITPRGLGDEQAGMYFDTGGKLLTAILRPESGGAITKEEWEQYGPLYLPWAGDSEEQVQRKVESLRQYMERLARGSGGAARYWEAPAPGMKPGATPQQMLDTPGAQYPGKKGAQDYLREAGGGQ
jgi:hypothetical protein